MNKTILTFLAMLSVLAFMGCSIPGMPSVIPGNPAITVPTLFWESPAPAPQASISRSVIINPALVGVDAIIPALVGFGTTTDYTITGDSTANTKSNMFDVEIERVSEEVTTYDAVISSDLEGESNFTLTLNRDLSFIYHQYLVTDNGYSEGIYDLTLNGTLTEDGYTATGTVAITPDIGLGRPINLMSGANSYGFITKAEIDLNYYWRLNGNFGKGLAADVPTELQPIVDSWAQ